MTRIEDGDVARADPSVLTLHQLLTLRTPELTDRRLRRTWVVDALAGELRIGRADHVAALSASLLGEMASVVTGQIPEDGPITLPLAVLGATALEGIPGGRAVAAALRHCHERWDGSGFPLGLSKGSIPVAAAIVGAADLMTNDPLGRLRLVEPGAFDPAIIDAAARVEPPLPGTVADHRVIDLLQARTALMSPSPATIGATEDEIATLITAIDDVEQVVAVLASRARRVLRADTVSAARFDDDYLRVLANVGDLGPNDEPFPTDQCYPLEALEHLDEFRAGLAVHLWSDAPDQSIEQRQRLRRRGLDGELTTPILIDGKPWGVIWATWRLGSGALAPTPAVAIEDMQRLAELMAAGIEGAHRRREFERLAFIDPLTRLGNRRVLVQGLTRIFEQPAADRRAAVIMADVDKLKVVNDTLGHEAGDQLLRDAADAMVHAAAAHHGAIVCRMGGDEFCVVIADADMVDAAAVRDRALEHFRRHDPQRSISCGIAVLDPSMESPSDVLRAADEAQYEQKRRNRLARGEAAGIVVDLADDHLDGARRRARRDH